MRRKRNMPALSIEAPRAQAPSYAIEWRSPACSFLLSTRRTIVAKSSLLTRAAFAADGLQNRAKTRTKDHAQTFVERDLDRLGETKRIRHIRRCAQKLERHR